MKRIVFTLILSLSMSALIAQEFPGKVKENILRAVIKIEIPNKPSGKQPNGTGFIISRQSKGNPEEREFF